MVQNPKEQGCTSMSEWLNKLCHTHTMEHDTWKTSNASPGNLSCIKKPITKSNIISFSYHILNNNKMESRLVTSEFQGEGEAGISGMVRGFCMMEVFCILASASSECCSQYCDTVLQDITVQATSSKSSKSILALNYFLQLHINTSQN